MTSPVLRRIVDASPRARSRSRAPVLPHDRVRDRLARFAIPDDRGLTLIGDADRGDVRRVEPRALDRLRRDGRLRRPDLLRVVLDPSGLRIDLPELLLRHRHDGTGVVEDDGARAGGALIESEEVFHSGFGLRFGRPRGPPLHGLRIPGGHKGRPYMGYGYGP
jgi:hypothetical protein